MIRPSTTSAFTQRMKRITDARRKTAVLVPPNVVQPANAHVLPETYAERVFIDTLRKGVKR